MTTTRSNPPFAVGIALAPALIGGVSVLIGVTVFAVLARDPGPPEEAAVRLFAVIFLALGVMLVHATAGALLVRAAHQRGSDASNPPVALLAFTTLCLVALVAPLHIWWRAPWPTFQNAVLVLDLLAAVFVLRVIVRLIRRRPAARPPVSAEATARARLRWTLAAAFFGISGVMIGTLGARQAAADWRGWSALQPAQGVVLRQHSFNFRDPDRGTVSMGAAMVQYTVDGTGYEVPLPMDPASPQFRPGAQVSLLYHPAQPGSPRLATALHVFLMAGVLLVAAISFLGLATVALQRAFRRRPSR